MNTTALLHPIKKLALAAGSLLLVALTATAPSLRAAPPYDAVNDFSLAANPNGVWSYGTLSSLSSGTFTLFTTSSTNAAFPGEQAWFNGTAFPNMATVSRNTSSGTATVGTVTYPVNQLHLDGENRIVCVRWTAPAARYYDVRGFFQRNDTSATPVSALIVKNTSSISFGSTNNLPTNGSQQTFSYTDGAGQGATFDFEVVANQANNDATGLSVTITPHLPFFDGEVLLSNDTYFLQSRDGKFMFGYYGYLTDPHYIFHHDLGYEYLFDANDGKSGIYFYDFASNTFFYTSPTFPFPYLYDFTLNAVLYYYPDTKNYPFYTSNPRYFYNTKTGQIITK